MIKDLTKGKPVKVLLLFALPMLLSMIFQQLYNLADSIVAGHFGGVNALAAISAATPVTLLFLAVAVGGTLGCSVVISKYFGARQLEKVKTATFTAIISLIIVAIVCTILGIFICTPVLKLLNTPKEVLDDASAYLKIYIFGFFFLFIYNIANSIFTGLGDSTTPLILLILSSVANIFMDIWFANIFANCVVGVAWATFVTQGIAGIIAIILLFIRTKKLKTAQKYNIFQWELLKDMTTVAIPSILQQSFVSVGQLMVQSLINGYGPETISGYASALKINSLAIMTIVTLSSSMSSYTAQNMGIHAYDRVQKGYHILLIFSMCLIGIVIAGVVIWSGPLIQAFLDEKPGENAAEVVRVGKQFLTIVAPFYVVVTIKVITDGVLRGAGCMKSFMFCTLLDLVIRVAISYILNPYWGFRSVCWAFAIGWVLATIASFLCYFYWIKKGKDRGPSRIVLESF